jgi:hypothetical protein
VAKFIAVCEAIGDPDFDTTGSGGTAAVSDQMKPLSHCYIRRQ